MERLLWLTFLGSLIGLAVATVRDMFGRHATSDNPLAAFVTPSRRSWVFMVIGVASALGLGALDAV